MKKAEREKQKAEERIAELYADISKKAMIDEIVGEEDRNLDGLKVFYDRPD